MARGNFLKNDDKKINLKDKKQHRPMVHWYSPSILFQSLIRHVVSASFGKRADHRLIQSLLHPIPSDKDNFKKEYDYSNELPKEHEKDDIWIDYVADIGDGFDSTYAVAYSLGRNSIKANGITLPRGDILIMGGDEVYPEPSRENYKYRTEQPYEYAFPDSDSKDADHPLLFMLPGNHDWYDGLQLFSAKYCNKRDDQSPFGSWRLQQKRSYFAAKLPDNWWIWGIDTQMTDDIDQPQHDYFKKIVDDNHKNNVTQKIILCTSVPSWTHDDKNKYNRGVGHVPKFFEGKEKDWKICAVLAGDLHHYSRYTSDDSYPTEFITAGGGGAFLHPTHQLRGSEKLEGFASSQKNEQHELKLKKRYPNKEISRKLCNKLYFFATIFLIILGILYYFFLPTGITIRVIILTILLTIFLISHYIIHLFSFLRISDYKNFLRMKITKEQLVIYAIGIDKVPTIKNEQWKVNGCYEKNNQNHAGVIPAKNALNYHIIEKITINISDFND